ncbi:hypothetical protein [Mycobacterium sp. GA-2829]|uniref:hypothetical protein n=1 Tax=Mycobacterium sp. GA-2829 TaxID=1772283 RepID=UPI00073FE09F|nr:hypothetical protein [Mycobacterium sp. GA-2829]KUI33861.1 hypothetical protein AU194_15180 [Mycobacterium sp. GA-2829]
MIDPELVLAVVSAAVGSTATVVVMVLRSPRRWCSDCGAVLPRVRVPASVREAVRGGWTCSWCRADLDSGGRRVVLTGVS